MLTAGNVFDQFSGTLLSSETSDVIPITIAPAEYGLTQDRMLVGFHVVGDTTFNPAAVEIRDSLNNLVAPLESFNNRQGTTDSLVLAQLPGGEYTISIKRQGNTNGAYTVNALLVGDANGDLQVDLADATTLTGAFGSAAADPEYLVEADADMNGQINRQDLEYWLTGALDTVATPNAPNPGSPEMAHNVFVRYTGWLEEYSTEKNVDLALDSEVLSMTAGRVLLGLQARGGLGHTYLNPAAVSISDSEDTPVTPLHTRNNLPDRTESLTLAQVEDGNLTVTLTGETYATGVYQLDVYLVGDANGDHRVDLNDAAILLGAWGKESGEEGYVLAADSRLNGKIGLTDFSDWLVNALETAPPPEQLMSQSSYGGGGYTHGPPETYRGRYYDRLPAVVPQAGYDPNAPMKFHDSYLGQVQPLPAEEGYVSGVYEVYPVMGDPWDLYDDYLYYDEFDGPDGSMTTMGFNWVYGVSTDENEIGYFVTDEYGYVDGIAPGAEGYKEAALNSARILYQQGQGMQDATIVHMPTGSYFARYSVVGGTTAEALAGEKDVWFSIAEANADLEYPHYWVADQISVGVLNERFSDTGVGEGGQQSGPEVGSYNVLCEYPIPDWPDEDDNPPPLCPVCPEPGPVQDVDTSSGNLTLKSTPGCITCDASSLPNYQSDTNPHPIIEVSGHWPPAWDMPERIEAQLTFGGLEGPIVYYDTTGINAGDEMRIPLQIDVSTLPTGRYDYEVVVTGYIDDEVSTIIRFMSDRILVNRTESEFGNRMWLDGLDRLYIEETGVALVRGDNTSAWYLSEGGGEFLTPVGGSREELVQNEDDSYTLTFPDGTRHEFDEEGLLTAKFDSNGRETSYAYTDADGDSAVDELASVTDPLGRVTTYAYSGGLLDTVTDFAGRVTTYEMEDGFVVSLTEPDPDGAGVLEAPVNEFEYYENGLVKKVTDPAGRITEFAYDFAGRLQEITVDGDTQQLAAADVQGLVDLSQIGYDAAHPAGPEYLETVQPEAITVDGRGNETRYEHDAFGLVTKITDDAGNITLYERDEHGRVTRMTEPDPDGAGPLGELVTEYEYDSRGNLLSVTYADEAEEVFTYDVTFSRVTSHTDPLGRLTLFEIDPASGDVLSTTRVVGEIDDEINEETDDVTTSFTYTDGTGDLPAGLLLTMTDALGRVTEYTYQDDDAEPDFGWLTAITYVVGTADEASVGFEYDAAGNLTAEIDELGRRTEYEYNALNQLVKTTLADSDGAGALASPEIVYAYCICGLMNSMTDANGNTTSYVYDEHRRLIQITQADPDGAGPLSAPVTEFEYDEAGNLASMLDSLSRLTVYGYDNLNRRTSTTLPDPDGAGGLTSPEYEVTYDAVGNVKMRTDALGNVTTYRYDERHRLVEINEADPDGVGPQSAPVTSYVYDAASQLVSVTDPLGRVTSYEYDDVGRLVKTTLPDPDGGGAGLAPWTIFDYDKVGNLLSTTDRLSNVTSYGYDNRNRRISETDANNDTTVFAYDDASNLVSLTDPEGNETTWVYDGLNRVIEETNELTDTRYFSYDAVGNLVQKIDRNDRYTEYEYDHLHRLIEERWLDPADDETVIHTINWVYDAASQLTEAADAFAEYEYTFDGLGRATSIIADIAGLTPVVTLSQFFNANNRRTSLAGRSAVRKIL